MLWKTCLLGLSALAAAVVGNAIDVELDPLAETRVQQMVSFETSHKRPEGLAAEGVADENAFQTAHHIGAARNLDADYRDFKMNLLPTKERPELNPVLSALINEDVMKSIESKRAIEQEELDIVRAEASARRKFSLEHDDEQDDDAARDSSTEASIATLTTPAVVIHKPDLQEEEDINEDFVDQAINLDAAGSENNKKSRIEIKKGPNGQDYEYEYVYYYEDEDDDGKTAAAAPAPVAAPTTKHSGRAKSRYSSIERSTVASPADNSLVSGKAKGRSSSAVADDIEPERLPSNTRFPSRGKHIDVQPTPALDSLENAAEKKKITVKRPSLELVDSDTFNTDEKPSKGVRNGDTEAKPSLTIEKERAAAAAAAAAAASEAKTKKASKEAASNALDEEDAAVTEKAEADDDSDADGTTPAMEKAALDLYAILANENFNMMTTDAAVEATTIVADTTDPDEDLLTTVVDEEPSSTSTTTTTTTTEATTTTTTTTSTTAAPSLYGGRRGSGAVNPGRNRFKLRQNAPGGASPSTTEAPAPPPAEEQQAAKPIRNRFSRPSIGGRNRVGAKTTAAPPAAEAPAAEEEVVAAKEVKPVSSGFSRNRPRNRFNIRGSTTTTEKSPQESADAAAEAAPEEGASSTTTARSALRGRPGLAGLRGRSRITTAKPAAAAEGEAAPTDAESPAGEEKPAVAAAPQPKTTRFTAGRPGGGRLPPRGKFGRTTEAPPAAGDDSAADSTHHNDIKGEGEEGAEPAEKAEGEAAPPPSANAGGLNRLKGRHSNNALHKTESTKPKAAPATLASPRKINPLLARRRLQLGPSTTEAAHSEESEAASPAAAEDGEAKAEEPAAAAAPTSDDGEAAKDGDDEAETTTKQQARGLGLLGQRRRLPLRKPGTIN